MTTPTSLSQATVVSLRSMEPSVSIKFKAGPDDLSQFTANLYQSPSTHLFGIFMLYPFQATTNSDKDPNELMICPHVIRGSFLRRLWVHQNMRGHYIIPSLKAFQEPS